MGQEAVELKKSLKGHFNELYGKGVYRVSTSDCLGKCKEGIHIVSYPEAKWFKNGTRESFEAICNYVKSSS